MNPYGRDELKWRIYRALSLAALAVLIVWTSCACSSLSTPEKMAIGSYAADLATTAYGLSNGATEANPLFRGENAAQVLVTAALLQAAIHWAIREAIEDKPLLTQKRIWRLVASVHFGVSTWNLTQTR